MIFSFLFPFFRSISPDNLKISRTSLITSGDSNKSGIDDRPQSGTIRGAHTVAVGHFSEDRINKRKYEVEKTFPNEEEVKNILKVSFFFLLLLHVF